MNTPYDWLTVAIFAGLTVLFLNRSVMDNPPDKVISYLPPAIGCAVVNYLGNEGMHLPAIVVLVIVGGYVVRVLNPFAKH
jgi:hypothetical protein